ncbi:hypothetical protein CASFOL_012989 [Castilleja foliolosa]|uniref:K+ potassium transporter integral membrane domain-containing protein n=1 Tax=Castilleja foliolosa TaxID=1961234 RepID=A0ABD3DMH6_9LAMI
MGQAAYLSRNISSIPNSFYAAFPDVVFWPVFVIATLATIVGSQAIISATFSIIKQCQALGCFPRVKVVHTSKQIDGQIYLPEINWILMILTLPVAISFPDKTSIGNAYGRPSRHFRHVHHHLPNGTRHGPRLATKHNPNFYFSSFSSGSSNLATSYGIRYRIHQSPSRRMGLSSLLLHVYHVHLEIWDTMQIQLRSAQQGPSQMDPRAWLGIVRVLGIGLVYSELATGVGPRPYRMHRCIVRYGYKDFQLDDGHFENQLIQSIAEFIQMEAVEPQFSSPNTVLYDGRMAVISSRTFDAGSSLIDSSNSV